METAPACHSVGSLWTLDPGHPFHRGFLERGRAPRELPQFSTAARIPLHPQRVPGRGSLAGDAGLGFSYHDVAGHRLPRPWTGNFLECVSDSESLAGRLRYLEAAASAVSAGSHRRFHRRRNPLPLREAIRLRWLASAELAVLLLIPYSNHFYNSFHFTTTRIQSRPIARSVRSQIFRCFSAMPRPSSALPSNQSYRPLVSTMLAFDYWLGNGLWPFWFHPDHFSASSSGSFRFLPSFFIACWKSGGPSVGIAGSR